MRLLIMFLMAPSVQMDFAGFWPHEYFPALMPCFNVWLPVPIEQPLQETVELMEDIVVEYLTEIVRTNSRLVQCWRPMISSSSSSPRVTHMSSLSPTSGHSHCREALHVSAVEEKKDDD